MKQLLVALFAQGVVQAVPAFFMVTVGWFLFCFIRVCYVTGDDRGGSTTDPVRIGTRTFRFTVVVVLPTGMHMLMLSCALTLHVWAIGLSDDVPTAVEQQARRLYRMTTCIAGTDVLMIVIGASVALRMVQVSKEWHRAVELVKERRFLSLVQHLLEILIGLLIVAIPPGWFAGQLYIAVAVSQQLLSDESLEILSRVNGTVLSQFLILIWSSMPGKRNDRWNILFVIDDWGLFLACACAFGAGMLFLTSNPASALLLPLTPYQLEDEM